MINKLSITIITKNEEKNIERCLKSVIWADEIVIVDSDSTDRTLEICKKYDCKIVRVSWLGFGKTKQLAVNSASNNWILSLDADEVVSRKLKNKILILLENPQEKAYKIKRISFYLGKRIKHSGWDKDFPLRLFNKKYAQFNEKIVHESVQTIEKKSIISVPIYHYTYPTLESHLNKMIKYSKLGAEHLYKKGKKSSIPKAVIRGIIKFFKMYFFKFGFLDGDKGLLLAFVSGFGVAYKYFKLWELNKNEKP